MNFGPDKARTVHAEHGLMYEDSKHHQRAAAYYKMAIMAACQHGGSDVVTKVSAVLVGVSEAYDAEWQDTGVRLPAMLHAMLIQ